MTPSPSVALDPRILLHGEQLRRRLPASAVAQVPQLIRGFAWQLDQRMAAPGWKRRLLEDLGLACSRTAVGLPTTEADHMALLMLMLLSQQANEDMKALLGALNSVEKTRSELARLLLQAVDHDQGRLRRWPPD